VETNAQLAAEHPQWNIEEIAAKTGVEQRYIAAPDETSADLATAAAEKLFREFGIDRSQCDFVLLCTQSPDYPLPTTACLIQQRLGLPNSVGAFDFNLGCSGFVYGLSMAEGLIRSGQGSRCHLDRCFRTAVAWWFPVRHGWVWSRYPAGGRGRS